jgi:hypothetical protein
MMFSTTVRLEKILLSSGTNPTPSFATSWGDSPMIFFSFNVMVPEEGDNIPMIVLTVVVFPAPFRPSSVANSPLSIVSDKSLRMWLSP